MRQPAILPPQPIPSAAATAALRGSVIVLIDLAALLVILPIPAALLLAPVLVPGDQIDLGFWEVDTPSEAWLASIPGVILVLSIAAAAVKICRLQRMWLMRWNTSEATRSHLTEPNPGRAITELTERETEVLELMSQGLTNGAIAERLVISESTVRKHVGRIFAKLDVDGKANDRRVMAVLTFVQASMRLAGALEPDSGPDKARVHGA